MRCIGCVQGRLVDCLKTHCPPVHVHTCKSLTVPCFHREEALRGASALSKCCMKLKRSLALKAHRILQRIAAKQARTLMPVVAAKLTLCGNVPAEVPLASLVAITAVLSSVLCTTCTGRENGSFLIDD